MRYCGLRAPVELALAEEARLLRLQRDVLVERVADAERLVRWLEDERRQCTCWRPRPRTGCGTRGGTR